MTFWKVFQFGSRLFGLFLAVVSVGMAVAIVAGAIPAADAILKWGIVSLLAVLAILGVAIVRAPSRTQK